MKTVDDGPTAQVAGNDDALLLHNQLCFALYSASLKMTKVYKPFLQELGLTYPQYLAMIVLWEQDGITVGDISARLLTDPGSLTPLLQRLEAVGLLRRTRGKEDERVVRLYLTAQGEVLREKALNIPPNILAASGISLGQFQSLQRDLNNLRGKLHDSL